MSSATPGWRLDPDLLVVGLLHLAGQLLEGADQALQLEGQRAQGEQHLSNFLGRPPGQLFDLEELVDGRATVALHQTAGEVDAHGNGADRLRRAVVEVARQFLAGLLMDFA